MPRRSAGMPRSVIYFIERYVALRDARIALSVGPTQSQRIAVSAQQRPQRSPMTRDRAITSGDAVGRRPTIPYGNLTQAERSRLARRQWRGLSDDTQLRD